MQHIKSNNAFWTSSCNTPNFSLVKVCKLKLSSETNGSRGLKHWKLPGNMIKTALSLLETHSKIPLSVNALLLNKVWGSCLL